MHKNVHITCTRYISANIIILTWSSSSMVKSLSCTGLNTIFSLSSLRLRQSLSLSLSDYIPKCQYKRSRQLHGLNSQMSATSWYKLVTTFSSIFTASAWYSLMLPIKPLWCIKGQLNSNFLVCLDKLTSWQTDDSCSDDLPARIRSSCETAAQTAARSRPVSTGKALLSGRCGPACGRSPLRGGETTQLAETSGEARGRARRPTLTWIIFRNSNKVEEALAGQQLCHGRQELVGHFSTSNPSSPGSLDASAAHLLGTDNGHRVNKKRRWNLRLDAALRYLLGGRDHVRRVKDEDVHLPLEPRQEAGHLKEMRYMSLIALQIN